MTFMETVMTAAPAPPAAPRTLVKRVLTDKAVWLVAAAAFGAEMAVSARYGYVRDELYFLASGRHLAAGGVDQPELTPLLARVDALLAGNSLAGLRVLPALAFAAMVLLTASMARILGAGRRHLSVLALREAKIGVLAAVIAALGASLSEVGAVIIVGGNIQNYDQTLASAVVQQVNDYANYPYAVGISLVLLGLIILLIGTLTVIQQRAGGLHLRFRTGFET